MNFVHKYIAPSLAALFLGVSVAAADTDTSDLNIGNDCLTVDDIRDKESEDPYQQTHFHIREAVKVVSKDDISRQRLEEFNENGGMLCEQYLESRHTKVNYKFPLLTINKSVSGVDAYATALLFGLSRFDQEGKNVAANSLPVLDPAHPAPFEYIENVLKREGSVYADAVISAYRLLRQTHYMKVFDELQHDRNHAGVARTLTDVKYNCPDIDDAHLKTILESMWSDRMLESNMELAVSRALVQGVKQSGNAEPLKAWIHKNKNSLHELMDLFDYDDDKKKKFIEPIEDTGDYRELWNQVHLILINKSYEKTNKDLSYGDDLIGDQEKVMLDNWACINGPYHSKPGM